MPKQIFNYIYIFVIIIWSPFSLYILKFDTVGRSIAILSLLVFMVNAFSIKFRKISFGRYTVFWLLWYFYTIINSIFFKGYNEATYDCKFWVFALNWTLAPYTILCIVIFESKNNKSMLLNVIILAFSFFFLLSILNGIDFNFGERNLNAQGNSLPVALCIFVFVLYLKLSYNDNIKHLVYLYIAFIVFIIALSGTRKAFMAAIIISFFYYLSTFSRFSIKTILRIIIVGLMVILLFGSILDSSFIGERFSEARTVGELENETDYVFLSFLGDRTYMYIEGMDMFLKNPITGVGIGNYMTYSLGSMMMHSELMVQLTEGGVLGTGLFFIFYFRILKSIIKSIIMRTVNRKKIILALGCFCACLFMCITASVYDNPYIFIAYGLIISEIYNCESLAIEG